ncbi:MAG: acyl-CoA dehydrogenase family protein [Burkholderiaceae bacterium]|nr:acyl-CoA dehydrogenase family protein [Burkholderiaceae bacterium]
MIDNLSLATIPPEDEALRQEVREFLRHELRDMPPHRRARSWGGFDAEFSRKLAARGWIGATLPRQWGGGGRSQFARFVLVEELLTAGAPVAAHWISERQSAPLINKFGTERQKELYIARVCRGEIFFCIGMSEPGSGSDLASVRTRAVPNGKGWTLNGQKIWTSNAHRSHYMIALVRTSGTTEDRHKGLSQFIIDLKAPGLTVRPIRDLAGDSHFCEVFFDNVQLDEDAMIGVEGGGWEQVNAELAFERSGPERIYSSIVLLEPWLQWLRAIPNPPVALLAQAGAIVSHLTALRGMSLSLTARLNEGQSPATEAALVKDLGTEFEQRLPTLIADTVYADPDHPPPAELMRTIAFLCKIAPSYSLRGGTREVLRGMIARGLGLR